MEHTTRISPENNANGPIEEDCPYDQGLIGQRLGDKYLIQAPLGSGGMSVVYRGHQESVDRTVAIKTLKLDMCSDPIILQRFQREIKGLSRLNHPNIVTVFDCIITDSGQPFVIMDFIDGESLEQLIQREKFLPPARAIKIFVQICVALEHAHRNGVVHRDIKPGNIMLAKGSGSADVVKVVDFGLAKLMENSQQRLTATGQLWGSLPYMSPEQCMADENIPIDNRSDIYSLGAVLYEALTGKDPFWRSDALKMLSNHIHDVPEPLKEANPDINVPSVLEAIVFKALEKAPDQRFQTMQEFKDALLFAGAPMLKAEEDTVTREMQVKLQEQHQRMQKQNKEKQNNLRKAQQRERFRFLPIVVISSTATLILTICGALFYSQWMNGKHLGQTTQASAGGANAGLGKGHKGQMPARGNFVAGHAKPTSFPANPTGDRTSEGHAPANLEGAQEHAGTIRHPLALSPHTVSSAKLKLSTLAEHEIKSAKHPAIKHEGAGQEAAKHSASKSSQRDYWGTLEGLHSGH